jgi:Fe-S cluster assembly protein SufD
MSTLTAVLPNLLPKALPGALRRPAPAYLDTLLSGTRQLSASPLAWLNALRTAAAKRLEVLPLPTRRDEDWRFTDIARLTKLSFTPSLPAADALENTDVEHFYIQEATTRLVFVDGIYAPQLSCVAASSDAVVANLPSVLSSHAALLEAHLGRYQDVHENPFAALNTAFLQDAAVIVLPRNVTLAAPVHVLFIATQAGVLSTPRCLLIAEVGSSVTLIEDYVALHDVAAHDAADLVSPVSEIFLADNARVKHIRVQRDSPQAFHLANCAVSVGRSSNYQSVSVALGAQISRYNLNVLLAEGAECAVDGLALIAADQLADSHTCIDHVQPHGVSRQLHKCIVGGSAHAVFNGKVMVRQGAQRTDSVQSSRNLLLSSNAQVDTKPQLEIFADDVKCAHGATIGQLDSEEVFYLNSRGLSDSVARSLLTYAFGAEIIERIPVASIKQRLEQTVLEHTGSLS